MVIITGVMITTATVRLSSLTEHLASASLSERIAAAKALGVDRIWDEMVLPLVNGKTAE